MDARKMAEVAERLRDDYGAEEEALAVLRWAAEIAPDDEDVIGLLAMTLVRLEQYEEARRLLASLPESGSSDTLNARAIAQAASFDLPGAVATLDRAISIDPGAAYMYGNRGLFKFHDGAYHEAALDLVRSVVISDGMFNQAELGSRRPELGDFRAILGGYKKIREETGKELPAFRLIDAWCELAKGKPRRTAASLSKLPPEERDGWAVIALRAAVAKAAHPKGSKAEIALLREARAKAPDEVTIVLRLGELDVPNDETRELNEELTRLAPGFPQAWIKAGSSRWLAKDREGGLAALDHAVEMAPGLWPALSLRATMRYEKGDLRGALEDYTTIIDLFLEDEPEPASESVDDWYEGDDEETISEVLCARARIRMDMRDLAGAEADLDLACARARSNEWPSFYQKAWLLAATGRRAEAAKVLNQAYDHEGMIDDVVKFRSRLRQKTGDEAGARAVRELLAKWAAAQEQSRRWFEESKKKAAKGTKKRKKG